MYKCTNAFFSQSVRRNFSYNQVISEREYNQLTAVEQHYFIKREEDSLSKHVVSGSDLSPAPDILSIIPDIINTASSAADDFDFGGGDFGGGGASGEF